MQTHYQTSVIARSPRRSNLAEVSPLRFLLNSAINFLNARCWNLCEIASSGTPRNDGIRVVLASILMLFSATFAHATSVRDLCEVQGARGNMLKGIGIVVGLSGTGDKAGSALEAQKRLLERVGFDVTGGLKTLKSDNAAVVWVTAELPAFAKEGTRIDVKVDSIYDAESLEGGQLLETFLKGPGAEEEVYAVAQGPISVGGFNADAGGGTKVRKNHVTGGRVPMGAYVEQEVPSTITDGQRLNLLLKKPDFNTADRIEQIINVTFGLGAAMALGAGTVQVTIPDDERERLTSFIARLQELKIQTDQITKVVINERTGTIVVGGDVMIKPCQVAHGSLTIKVATTPEVTPALPFTDAKPVVTEQKKVDVTEEEAFLMPVQGTSAGSVAEALNRLRVTPRDMISIFQALREAGALEADLELM